MRADRPTSRDSGWSVRTKRQSKRADNSVTETVGNRAATGWGCDEPLTRNDVVHSVQRIDNHGLTTFDRPTTVGQSIAGPTMTPSRDQNLSVDLRLPLLLLLVAFVGLLGCQSAEPEVDETPATEVTTNAADAAAKQEEPSLPWSFRPYRVAIWLIPDDHPRWTSAVMSMLSQQLDRDLGLIEPAAWKTTTQVVPNQWRDLLTTWQKNTAELPVEFYEALKPWDKLVLVRLGHANAELSYDLNELDVNGWSLGPTYSGTTAEFLPLPGRVADTIAQAFRPIVRIEHSEQDIVTTRVRAHGLMVRSERNPDAEPGSDAEFELVENRTSPCWIETGEIFEPVVRLANRRRVFELKGIESLDFTMLVQQDAVDGPYVRARVVSVNRADVALTRKKGRNTEKIGIVVRTPPGNTTIRLFTLRGTSARDLAEFPLNGYQIYSRSIYGTEDSFEYLGKTNWDGVIEIEPGDERVRLLLVKNGERNLARLPVMPGYKPVMEKLLPDDEERITAEGVVSGLKSESLDLWARRKVLAERIRLALEKNEFAMANRYYELYRQMVGVNQWRDLLADYERRLASSEKRQQKKISDMFKELTEFATKEFKLDDDTKVQEMMLNARQQRLTD